MILETFRTIYWPVILGNEGDLGGLSAVRANRIVHFTGTRIIPANAISLTSVTAGFTPGRLVLESFFCIKSLFPSSEYELFAAIPAN